MLNTSCRSEMIVAYRILSEQRNRKDDVNVSDIQVVLLWGGCDVARGCRSEARQFMVRN